MSMPRFEHKYRVSEELALEIQKVAEFHVEPDQHSRNGEYIVNSLYFDTPRNEDFQETDEGVALRSKVRLRCYSLDPQPPFFLELKQRFGSSIYKTRMFLDPADAERMANGLPPSLAGEDGSANRDLDTIREVIDRRRMTPRVWVRYTRQAWTSSWGDGARMTIDRMIEAQGSEQGAAGSGSEGWVFAELDSRVVLELKFFGAAPRWMQRLAYDFELERTSCSKYGACLCTLEGSPTDLDWAQAS